MNHHPQNVSMHPAFGSVMAEAIALRAYELWVSCGEPDIYGDAVWREAERELLTERTYQEPATNRYRRSG
jgi:hypothetical protein